MLIFGTCNQRSPIVPWICCYLKEIQQSKLSYSSIVYIPCYQYLSEWHTLEINDHFSKNIKFVVIYNIYVCTCMCTCVYKMHAFVFIVLQLYLYIICTWVHTLHIHTRIYYIYTYMQMHTCIYNWHMYIFSICICLYLYQSIYY